MTIEFIMQYDEAYAELGNIARERVECYCATWPGCCLRVSRELTTPDPLWSKPNYVLKCLRDTKADCLFWMDADALIVDLDFDLQKLLESLLLSKLMACSRDYNGLCAGVFGIRVSDWAENLLRAWTFLGQLDDESDLGGGRLHDQATLMLLDRRFDSVRSCMTTIPESIISNPSSRERGKFMHHFWAFRSQPDIIASEMRAVRLFPQ